MKISEAPDWLDRARNIAKSFKKCTKGGHHVYCVLLRGKKDKYAVYVGETRYKPMNRLKRHRAGIQASRHVKKRGIRLLPVLYRHLNPLSRSEAKEIERDLAQALKASGIETYGGH